MGKFLESLRQAAPRPAPAGALAPQNAAPAPAIELDKEEEDEIPYIEVGPHKSMEASASVLATRPAMAVPKPAVTFRPSAADAEPRRPHFAPEIMASRQPNDLISAQYRDLLAALTPAASGEGARGLLFAPGLPDADAAAVLLNLAVTAVRQQGKRVIVVDADPHVSALADRLGLAARPGFVDVLSGAVAIEQALQQTDLANLTVLTAGAPSAAGLRLVIETPASLMRKLKQGCDFVFVLGPQWDEGGAALAAACDAAYLVLPEREAFSPRLDELLQMIPRQGTRLGGCILAAG